MQVLYLIYACLRDDTPSACALFPFNWKIKSLVVNSKETQLKVAKLASLNLDLARPDVERFLHPTS